MPFTVAVAGKGGTGKTTVAALLVKLCVAKKLTPVLALDADANANLGDVLGVQPIKTVGAVREDVLESITTLPAGMTKESFMELKIQSALVESAGFDLLVMGRPEGPGCYCYANSIFRKFIDIIAGNYRTIVLDNEAGMEHLSRHLTQDVDVLFIVSDLSLRGIDSAGRINALIDELGLKIDERYLLINRAQSEPSEAARDAVARSGLKFAGWLPEDDMLADFDMNGRSLYELPMTSPAVASLADICHNLEIL